MSTSLVESALSDYVSFTVFDDGDFEESFTRKKRKLNDFQRNYLENDIARWEETFQQMKEELRKTEH